MQERILRFTASWCNPCKQLAKTLESTDLKAPIEVIDVDADQAMTYKHGVRGVPTMIFMRGNQEVSRISGSKTQEELMAWRNSL